MIPAPVDRLDDFAIRMRRFITEVLFTPFLNETFRTMPQYIETLQTIECDVLRKTKRRLEQKSETFKARNTYKCLIHIARG